MEIRAFARIAFIVFGVLIVATLLAQRGDPERGAIITGRVVDPHQLRPEGAVLMLGREHAGGMTSMPVPLGPDGRFMTRRLDPGTYVLEIVRTPHSATTPAVVVGFRIVEVSASDVSGVVVEVRRDTAIRGRFRMESDDPAAEWPPHIVVNAFLALDGMPLLGGTVAEGAPAGEFILRNAFGPRVLRCGYTLAHGSPWWFARVVLDGRDITNVPTDFSGHEHGQLDVVFTQHPAWIIGTVTDSLGLPVQTPWIRVAPADRAAWQLWATTYQVVPADTLGKFSVALLPGEYVVAAVPRTAFESLAGARRSIFRFPPDGLNVTLQGDRQVKTVHLTVEER